MDCNDDERSQNNENLLPSPVNVTPISASGDGGDGRGRSSDASNVARYDAVLVELFDWEVAEARRNQFLASLASMAGTYVTCVATQMIKTTRNNATAPSIMLQLVWEQ
eukprot:1755775-Ditylum_brightwellii.AAC.1